MVPQFHIENSGTVQLAHELLYRVGAPPFPHIGAISKTSSDVFVCEINKTSSVFLCELWEPNHFFLTVGKLPTITHRPSQEPEL